MEPQSSKAMSGQRRAEQRQRAKFPPVNLFQIPFVHGKIEAKFFDAANTGRTGAKNEKIHGQKLPSRDKNCSEVV